MIGSRVRHALTFGIYPTSRGFGWVAFESPLSLYDWGIVEASKNKNVVCLRRIEKLIERLQPEVLVLEAFERRNSARTDRIARLCRAVVALANDRGVEAAIYSRLEIGAAFAPIGARTRHEIAEAVALHVPVLQHRLPAKRRAWESEDRRLALFNAAALVLTHYRHQASLFLNDRKEAA